MEVKKWYDLWARERRPSMSETSASRAPRQAGRRAGSTARIPLPSPEPAVTFPTTLSPEASRQHNEGTWCRDICLPTRIWFPRLMLSPYAFISFFVWRSAHYACFVIPPAGLFFLGFVTWTFFSSGEFIDDQNGEWRAVRAPCKMRRGISRAASNHYAGNLILHALKTDPPKNKINSCLELRTCLLSGSSRSTSISSKFAHSVIIMDSVEVFAELGVMSTRFHLLDKKPSRLFGEEFV